MHNDPEPTFRACLESVVQRYKSLILLTPLRQEERSRIAKVPQTRLNATLRLSFKTASYSGASPSCSNARVRPWWERRNILLVLLLIGLTPLLWPALPPLSDLPGHMGRWHIAISISRSAALASYYTFTWAPVGNLGMDLLVPALTAVIPFETAVKLCVIIIPALTMAGLIWTALEVHGRIPSTILFALPFAYAWPFQFGFVNFTLAQGLAFCVLAFWIRLGRYKRLILRAAVFVPISLGLWLAHSFGWGMFCLMAIGAELARLRVEGRTWLTTLLTAAVQSMPLALPLTFLISTSSGQNSGADDWFDWAAKGVWVASILRDRWETFDIASLIPVFVILYGAARDSKLGFSALLGWPALLCLVAFIILPRLALGGAYVDMRIAPAVVMLGLLAIQPSKGSVRFGQIIAALAVTFFLVRTGATTTSFVFRAAEQQRELDAISSIPHGASVLSLVSRPCNGVWSDLRRDHLPGMAIVRRDIFTNEQWALEGQQLLRIRYSPAAPYLADPSQLVYPSACPDIGSRFNTALRQFPRDGFSHVWTIGFPPNLMPLLDLQLIWTNGGSALYQVRHQTKAESL